MSLREKILHWFEGLPDDKRTDIEEKIEEIRLHEEIHEKQEQTLRRLVKQLAMKLEELVDDPSQISLIIKQIAGGRISDRTIEDALPEDKKRKYKALPRPGKPQTAELDDNSLVNRDKKRELLITSSTDGSTNTDDEFGQGVVPREINESEIQERDQDITGLKDEIKELERELKARNRENIGLQAKLSDTTVQLEATKQDLEKMRNKVLDLQDALAKVSFVPASQTAPSSSATQIFYVTAGGMIDFWSQLRKAMNVARETRRRTQAEDDKRHIILEFDSDGKVVNARCEE